MRELRKFAVDCVSHHPSMKLEYIGLDHTVERLLRKPKKVKASKTVNVESDKDAKPEPATNGTATSSSNGVVAANPDEYHDATETPTTASVNGSHALPPMINGLSPLAETAQGNEDSSSSDESEGEDAQPLLKIETLDNVKLYDVYGVRIFRKDMVAGRL